MKALIVDDSRAMRMFLRTMVREHGFDVAEAEHGLAALEQLLNFDHPELMLVDWHMPEMNGLELVERVRSDGECEGMRILMVSSESDGEVIARALEAGADDYLMKPFSLEELKVKLEQLGLLDD